MPSDIKPIILVVFAPLAAACSSTPATSTSRTDEPAAAAAPAIAPGTASAATAAPSGVVDASLVKAGYSVMRRHGQVLYCRNEIITGGRIATRICLTAAQIQAEKQDVAKAKDLMNDHYNRCMGPECTS